MKKISSFILTAFIASSILIAPAQANETTGNIPTSEELTCIQTAITARDSAIATAYDAYTTAAKAALTARTAVLKEAWAKSSVSEIQTAIKEVWQTYRRSLVTARITFRRAKNAAWKQFRTDKTTCFTGNKAEIDTTDSQADAQL